MALSKLAKIRWTYSIVAVMGIVATVGYYEEFKMKDIEIPVTQVYVVNKNIDAGNLIKAEDIIVDNRFTIDIQKETNVITDVNDIVGKRALVPIYEDELLRGNDLTEDKNYLKYSDKDKTLYNLSIKAEEDTVGPFKRGNYIDIWAIPVSSQEGRQAIKVFSDSIQLVEIYDDSLMPCGESGAQKVRVLTVSFSANQIITYENFNADATYKIRFTSHFENTNYEIFKELRFRE